MKHLVNARIKQVIVLALEHRSEHQHLFFLARSNLVCGALAIQLADHQEQVDEERRISNLFFCSDLATQLADPARVNLIQRSKFGPDLHVIEVGDAPRQDRCALILQAYRCAHWRADTLLDQFSLAPLHQLQSLAGTDAHGARSGTVNILTENIPTRRHNRELLKARLAQNLVAVAALLPVHRAIAHVLVVFTP